MTEPVTIALVGCGWISEQHVAGYRVLAEAGCDQCRVVACVDPDLALARARAQALAAATGREPAVFANLTELASRASVDAVDLCVPHHLHHRVAEEALAHGWHVLIEKPVGITMRAGRRIIAAGERAGRIVATAENVRRTPHARAARWAIAEAGLIGMPQAVDVQVSRYAPLPIEDPKFRWRAIKLLTGGGMIIDSGYHLLDMLLHSCGPVRDVRCHARTLDQRTVDDAPGFGSVPVDVEDTWHATLRFESGLIATWGFSKQLPGEAYQHGRIAGTAGSLTDCGNPMHLFQHGATLHGADGTTHDRDQLLADYRAQLSPDQHERWFPYGVEHPFAIEIHDFARAIRTGTAPEVDAEAGQLPKAVAMACYESSARDQTVAVADVLSGAISTYQDPIDEHWGLLDAVGSGK